jgi:signal transduction histidine kinase
MPATSAQSVAAVNRSVLQRSRRLRHYLLGHEIAMLLVVLLVGALGAVGSYIGHRQAEQAQRIGSMLEQLHRLHAEVHDALQEGIRAAQVLDPMGREQLDDFAGQLEATLARLSDTARGKQEREAVVALDGLADQIRGDLAQLFSGTASERERQRLAMLASDYRDGAVGEFDREVARLTENLALSAEAMRARLLYSSRTMAWLPPLLVILVIALVWFTRSNLRRQVDLPVASLRQGVERVGQGELTHRIAPTGALELAELAAGLNHMAAELTRQREELLANERDVALGRLVPVVAHNIRNPLASIRAASQLLEGANREECGQIGTDIIASVDRLERWTRTLLNYLNPAHPKRRRVLLRHPVDEALEATRFRIEQKHLTCDFEDHLPGLEVEIDPDLVEQALHGLLVNAVEASPVGSQLSVAIDRDDEDVHLVIEDSGPGIGFAPQPGALQPGPSSKRYGTGLGIPFAYKVFGAHGWTLYFAKVPQGGTRVTVRLGESEGRSSDE